MKIQLWVLSLAFIINGYAQTFAPTGAKWYYGNRENPFGSSAEGYKLVEVTGDTIINTKACKVFHSEYFESSGIVYDMGDEFFYMDMGIIYHFINNNFEVLYDFNLSAGDTLKIREPYYTGINFDTLINYVIDSTGTELINGNSNKSMYLRDGNNYWDYFTKVIENIGSIEYFLPQTSFDCDAGICYTLRCYEDSGITYHNVNYSCDTLILENGGLYVMSELWVYPNPVNDYLYVDMQDYSEEIKCEIYNILSQKVFSCILDSPNNKLDLSNMQSGVYLISYIYNKHNYIKKIIINKEL